MARYIVHIDGAAGPGGGARGAGLAVVVRDERGRVCRLLKERLPGPVTNNEAEYAALLLALRALIALRPESAVILSDSEVMVNQIAGRFRVNSPALQPLHREACALLAALPEASLRYVERDQNRLADALAWEAANGWAEHQATACAEA